MKREANSEDSGEIWLPELSFTTVLTVVGIGLTAADLFFRFYTSKTEKELTSAKILCAAKNWNGFKGYSRIHKNVATK